MFQSSPGPKAGSYLPEEQGQETQEVSILSRPESRELLMQGVTEYIVLTVSILSRPESRELPGP